MAKPRLNRDSKTTSKLVLSFVTILFIFTSGIPSLVLAHQPRIVESRLTIVTQPEISKAYYSQLTGVPDVYTIVADTPFDLYVNVLVPNIVDQKKDIVVTIEKDKALLTTLDGTSFTWTEMFEPFGYDSYFMGPEYKLKVNEGTYTITVRSTENDSKYSLAIGEAENFNFTEILNALTLVPQLKSSFFNESPISFILSPFGWGLILSLYALAAIFATIYRFTLKKFAKGSARSAHKNIGTNDRLVRLTIGVGLLAWAITTTWSPTLIFLSGFALFEALFSWCGLYAALGRNTCPVD